jgi:hypothetical protein
MHLQLDGVLWPMRWFARMRTSSIRNERTTVHRVLNLGKPLRLTLSKMLLQFTTWGPLLRGIILRSVVPEVLKIWWVLESPWRRFIPPVHLLIILRCYCLPIQSYLSAKQSLKRSRFLDVIILETEVDLVDVPHLFAKLLLLRRQHWPSGGSSTRLGLRRKLNIGSLPALKFLLQQLPNQSPKVALARKQHLFNVCIQALSEVKRPSHGLLLHGLVLS